MYWFFFEVLFLARYTLLGCNKSSFNERKYSIFFFEKKYNTLIELIMISVQYQI